MKGSLDGASTEIGLMLGLAPEYRISTITRYLAQLDRRLCARRFRHSVEAIDLRERIRVFNAGAVTGPKELL
ncbi:hypothetical protein [Actinomadura gamaensis]|uniref:Uncharacterized protein n=1 Tax=Actinomadura gamaensis TaxID=1763541 RepID=A0ABV9TZ83_9ACTN